MPVLISSQIKRLLISIGASVLFSGIPLAVNAAPITVTLSIPGMDCAVCPITVNKGLSQVPGVSQTIVNFDRRQAVVTFDDTKTTVGALTDSTKNEGYPMAMWWKSDPSSIAFELQVRPPSVLVFRPNAPAFMEPASRCPLPYRTSRLAAKPAKS